MHYIPHDPTTEEIAAACAEIQAGWDEREYERRSAVKSQPVVAMEVKISEVAAEMYEAAWPPPCETSRGVVRYIVKDKRNRRR